MEKLMEANRVEDSLFVYNNIMKANDNIYRDLARKLGLSECGLWILYALRTEHVAPVPSEIGVVLHQPKQTIHSALKKLETDGCIELVQGKDHRSKQIVLTDAGLRLCRNTVDRVIAAERAALAGLSGQERENFLDVFSKFTGLFQEQADQIG